MSGLGKYLLAPGAGRALLVTGGAAPSKAVVDELRGLVPAASVYSADAGADVCRRMNLLPHFIVGDMDSLSQETYNWAQANGVELLRFPPEKDDTDTQLAVNTIIEMRPDIEEIVVLGALGGRMDHELANIALLVGTGRCKGPALIYIDEQNAMRYLGPGELDVSPSAGYFGIAPMSENGMCLAIQHAKYPLPMQTVPFGVSRLVSNEFDGERHALIRVETGDGVLIVSRDGKDI